MQDFNKILVKLYKIEGIDDIVKSLEEYNKEQTSRISEMEKIVQANNKLGELVEKLSGELESKDISGIEKKIDSLIKENEVIKTELTEKNTLIEKTQNEYKKAENQLKLRQIGDIYKLRTEVLAKILKGTEEIAIENNIAKIDGKDVAELLNNEYKDFLPSLLKGEEKQLPSGSNSGKTEKQTIEHKIDELYPFPKFLIHN